MLPKLKSRYVKKYSEVEVHHIFALFPATY
jgi:hypothetical protein